MAILFLESYIAREEGYKGDDDDATNPINPNRIDTTIRTGYALLREYGIETLLSPYPVADAAIELLCCATAAGGGGGRRR